MCIFILVLIILLLVVIILFLYIIVSPLYIMVYTYSSIVHIHYFVYFYMHFYSLIFILLLLSVASCFSFFTLEASERNFLCISILAYLQKHTNLAIKLILILIPQSLVSFLIQLVHQILPNHQILLNNPDSDN